MPAISPQLRRLMSNYGPKSVDGVGRNIGNKHDRRDGTQSMVREDQLCTNQVHIGVRGENNGEGVGTFRATFVSPLL